MVQFFGKKELEVTVAVEQKSSTTEEPNEEIPLLKKEVSLNISNNESNMVNEIEKESIFYWLQHEN